MTVSQILLSAFSGFWGPDRAAVPVQEHFDSQGTLLGASFVIAIAVGSYEKEGPTNRLASLFCVTVSCIPLLLSC